MATLAPPAASEALIGLSTSSPVTRRAALTARRRQPSIQSQLRWLSLGMLLPLLVALGILAYQIKRFEAATRLVNATHEAIHLGMHLVKISSDMGLAIHAYALTGDDLFLKPYQQARASWPAAFHAAALSIDDPAQSARLSQVEHDTDEFLTQWEGKLETLRPGGDDQTAWFLIGQDDTRLRRISATIADFVHREEQLISSHLLAQAQARHRLYAVATASGLVTIALFVLFTAVFGPSIARPIERVAAAAQRLGAGRLNERVAPAGGRELHVLAGAFNQMAGSLQHAQSALNARHRELERTSARLATANEDMLERQRETDDFLYVLSHDLRAPLINIQGFGKRLQTNMTALETSVAAAIDGEPVKLLGRMSESLRFVNAGTAKIDQLISRLLEIARLTTRQSQHAWIDTDTLVHDVFRSCHFQLEERGIATSVGVLPRVFGDSTQLNQVFTNLVDNAIKYMGERPHKQISIACSEQGDRYRFAVTDTGPGIAPKDQEKVFRMFSRLTPNVSLGEGIGLTAVRAIINRHGGRIWVESTLAVGSTFYFTLPRHPAEETAMPGSMTATKKEDHAHAA